LNRTEKSVSEKGCHQREVWWSLSSDLLCENNAVTWREFRQIKTNFLSCLGMMQPDLFWTEKTCDTPGMVRETA
jgi:hypothetical protein